MEFHRNVFFPNLLTLGNGICGFAALGALLKVPSTFADGQMSEEHLAHFATAGWLVLLGMVFDVFDGKVARLAGASSSLGAQLDSLCDLVTFGLVPAVMMLRLAAVYPVAVPWWGRAVWFFSLAYFLGATLRLARFTAEQEPDESAHEAFKGLPTPGAAGCVASLVIFFTYIMTFKAKELQWLGGAVKPETLRSWVECVPVGLPVLGLVLGFVMVSNRLIYDHLGSWIFSRRHSFDFFVYLVFALLLIGVFPEPILPILFLGYLVFAPAKLTFRWISASSAARRHPSGGQPPAPHPSATPEPQTQGPSPPERTPTGGRSEP